MFKKAMLVVIFCIFMAQGMEENQEMFAQQQTLNFVDVETIIQNLEKVVEKYYKKYTSVMLDPRIKKPTKDPMYQKNMQMHSVANRILQNIKNSPREVTPLVIQEVIDLFTPHYNNSVFPVYRDIIHALSSIPSKSLRNQG